MRKRTPEAIARIRELAAAGALANAIARDLGVSPSAISEWAKWAGIRLPTRSEVGRLRGADPAYRARQAEFGRKGARVGRPPQSDIVPRWVPRDLKGEYIDAAILYGEEQAASIVRRMKAEASAPC